MHVRSPLAATGLLLVLAPWSALAAHAPLTAGAQARPVRDMFPVAHSQRLRAEALGRAAGAGIALSAAGPAAVHSPKS